MPVDRRTTHIQIGMTHRTSHNDSFRSSVAGIFQVTVINKADAPADEKAFVVKAMPYNEFAEKIAQLEADGVSVLSSIRVADL